jgi:glycerophosphoryl diester phosphodiesterase
LSGRTSILAWLLFVSSVYLIRSPAEGEPGVAQESRPIVIAHRGASGYLPEHTIASATMGYAQGADFIEPDVVLSKDGAPLVLHDIHLETTTDVRDVFPDRAHVDGRYYAIDFTLEEIKRLHVTSRIDPRTGKPVYPNRFPTTSKGDFRVPTLSEEIELVQGLNQSTGRNVGIYPEIKQPAWHQQQGQDITKIVLTVLSRYGYRDRNASCFLQCFDLQELKRLRGELSCDLKLIWLLDEDSWKLASGAIDQDTMQSDLKLAAEYVDGIGPAMRLLVDVGTDNKATPNNVVATAHELGLLVHPYTFRKDALPDFATNFDELIHLYVNEIQVDGFFTDFPDQARQACKR